MPSAEGFVQAYSAQAVVAHDSHLIVANHLSQQPNDKQEIAPALERLNGVESRLGKPQGVLADAGYFSADNVQRCEAGEITPYICDRRERHHLPVEERFQSPLPCPADEDVASPRFLVHSVC